MTDLSLQNPGFDLRDGVVGVVEGGATCSHRCLPLASNHIPTLPLPYAILEPGKPRVLRPHADAGNAEKRVGNARESRGDAKGSAHARKGSDATGKHAPSKPMDFQTLNMSNYDYDMNTSVGDYDTTASDYDTSTGDNYGGSTSTTTRARATTTPTTRLLRTRED
ncbi:hypothetical protein EV121DRAFT_297783 [Schizophyllum commune]